MHSEQTAVATPDAARTNAWAVGAWMILAVDAVFALALRQLQTEPEPDIVKGAVFVTGLFVLVLFTLAGVACALFSAAVAYRSGDRRFVIALPAFAHVALLIVFFAIISQGRG